MIAESNRPQRVKSPFFSRTMQTSSEGESSALGHLMDADAWEDALDPSIPAEPLMALAFGRHEPRRQPSHKLILKGLLLGALLQTAGYLAAAHWL